MEDDEQKIIDLVNKYISVKLPDANDDPELYKLVSEVQMHSRNHTKTCQKNNKTCRFGFPQLPLDKTIITKPEMCENLSKESRKKFQSLKALLEDQEWCGKRTEELLTHCDLSKEEYEHCLHGMSRSNKVIYEREPKDCRVNPHNVKLLKAWRANIDVQVILSVYACLQYICGYMTKAESEMSDHLHSVIKNMDQNKLNESDEMKEVMQAYSKKREVSAQECTARVCGLRLKQCSRVVIFLPTDSSVKMSRPMAELEKADGDDIWMASLLDKYRSRPETQEFEEMCYADFGSTCRVVYGDEKNRKNVLPLLNDMGYVKKRTCTDKNAIIRYYRYSPEKNPEQFHCNLLTLYLPHRGEFQLKTPAFPTFQSFYEGAFVRLPFSNEIFPVRDIVNENRKKYEKHGKSIELALKEQEEKAGLIDAWCELAPESERERLECLEEIQNRPDDDDVQENDPDLVRQLNIATDVTFLMEPPKIEPSQRQLLYQSLNQMQASTFHDVRNWCIKKVDNVNTEPFCYYINGGAGTGKSHLIKCIYAEASEILSKMERNAFESDPSKPTVLLSAFTGTAAFNICGTTLHTLLKLPRSLKPPYQGLGNKLDEVRAELMNAEILIIDEISMVSKELFAYVNFRLQQIKGTNKAFGGMSVLAVGDFYQLPPIHSKPLCVFEANNIDLWNDNFQMIVLTEIMRQKDDKAFAETLNRIRVKTITDDLSEDDRKLLLQAVIEPEKCPTDVLHIFATNRFVKLHNTKTLALLYKDIVRISADDYKKDARTGTMELQAKPYKEDFNGLAAKLELAIGARVMLTRNIDLSQGLVNGAFANLTRVVYSPSNPTHVLKLGLDLDNKNPRRSGSDHLVYLVRLEENITKKKGMVRRQFPIKLAFACTIHKVQGMTTSSAVVSFKQIFQAGMGYVAVSRVTSLSGLHIIDMDETNLYANPGITDALDKMRKANLEHIMPFYLISQTLDKSSTFSVIHHNTQGLPSHIQDIQAHHELRLSDVLCFTETRLQCFVAPALHLEGYTMYERSRHVSYTNFSDMASKDGGGVAIYVKNHIVAHEIRYVHNVTDLEFVVVQVESPFTALIVTIYRPPTYNVKPFLQNLTALLECLEMLDTRTIIVCGDLNENLLYYGKKPIMEVFQSKGYGQLISSATTDRQTLLDVIYVSNPQSCLHSGVLQAYYSYHCPVFCVMSIT
ncbi:unnamed protein product [Knipowitschia caucasica]